MDFLDKLRKKPEKEKKIIIWSILIAFGLAFLLLWVYTSQRSIRSLNTEQIIDQMNLPPREELPQIQEPSEEDLKALEELFEQAENAQ